MTNLDEIKNLIGKEYQEAYREYTRLNNLLDSDYDLTESDFRAEEERFGIVKDKLDLILDVAKLLYDPSNYKVMSRYEINKLRP